MAQSHLRHVARCSRAVEKSHADLEQSILDARDSGETLRDIAKAAGMSHQRIWQIVNWERRAK